MKESSIRPVDLMHENAVLRQEDIRLLLEQRSEFVEVPCPACESPDYQAEFEKEGFTFVSCSNCETLFVNPRPTAQALFTFYANSRCIRHWNDQIFPASEETRRAAIFRPRAERVLDICRANGANFRTLLDVGAGFGTFCEEMDRIETFNRVIAVEPATGLAETCRQKGLEVIESPIEEVSLQDEVEVITNFELIEHLFDPKEFLLGCAQALPPGGLLILTTPNIKGFDLSILGPLSGNIAAPNHLNYFHPESLAGLLVATGFDVLEIQTPGKLDAELVRNKALSGQLDLSGQPFLKQILVDGWESLGGAFQQFLSDHGLSSHLWMVAKRR